MSFDFAEDEARCCWSTPLILSEVEGYGPEKEPS
jgi:hypothetical protein